LIKAVSTFNSLFILIKALSTFNSDQFKDTCNLGTIYVEAKLSSIFKGLNNKLQKVILVIKKIKENRKQTLLCKGKFLFR